MKMTFIAPLLAALAIPAPAYASDAAEKNKALVDKYLGAVHRGDTKAMGEMLADDFMGYGLGVNDSANKAKTLEDVRHHWEVYKYGGKRYRRIQAIAMTTDVDGGRGRGKGDWVFEWGDLAIDYPASSDYGPAKTATFAFHAVFRIKNGKIDTITNYFNHEDIMKQLGYQYLSLADQKKVSGMGLTFK